MRFDPQALLAYAHGLLKLLNPIQWLDRALLRSLPLVWRTRIFHVMWFSLLGLLAFYAIGRSVPIDATTIPTIPQMDLYEVLVWISVVVAMGYWLFLLWQVPLYGNKITAFAATAVLYFAAVFCAALAPAGFNAALTNNISRTVPHEVFDSDLAALRPYANGSCFFRPPDKTDADIIKTFADITPRYGFTEPEIDCGFHECRQQTCIKLLRSGGVKVPGSELASRIWALDEAKQYSRHGTGFLSGRANPFDGDRLLVCGLLAVLLTILFVRNDTLPLAFDLRGKTARLLLSPDKFAPRRLVEWRNRLLTTRPFLWATKIHVLVLFSTFILISAFILSLFASIILDIFLVSDSYDPQNIFMIGFFCISGIGTFISSSYQINSETILQKPEDHGNFIISIVFPSLPLILLIWLVGLFWDIFFPTSSASYEAVAFFSSIALSQGAYFIAIMRYIYKISNPYLTVFWVSAMIALYLVLFYFYVEFIELILIYVFFVAPAVFVVTLCIVFTRYFYKSLRVFAFSIFIATLPSTLLFLLFFIFLFAPGSFGVTMILTSFFAITFPGFCFAVLCRPLYRVVHGIYMSPSPN